MTNRRLPPFTLSFLSSAKPELHWLAPLAFAVGVFESVFLVPLNLAVPGLGQGDGIWDAPRAAAFLAAFAAGLLAAFAHERRIPPELRNHWGDSLSVRGPALCAAAGMVGMLAYSLGMAPTMLGVTGSLAEGTGAAACLIAVMGHLKRLRPDSAASTLSLALVVATAVMLVAGSTDSPWFIAAHIVLVGLGCLAWRAGLRRMPDTVQADGPIAEVWGQYESRHTFTAVAQYAAFGLYGLVAIAAADMRCTEGGEMLLQVDNAVTLVGGFIYVAALASLMLFYGSRHAMSVTRCARMALSVTGVAAFCIAYVPQLSLVAQSTVMSVQVFWVQVFLLMALPIMRSGVRPVGEAVGVTNAFLALATALAVLFGRKLLDTLGIAEVLFAATVVAMLVLSCCIQQTEPNFASSQQTGPQFLDELAPRDAVRFGPAIMRYKLTAREADLLPLLASGISAAAMAEKLCISLPTVNTHVRHIYAKMDVHGRDELIAKLGMRG